MNVLLFSMPDSFEHTPSFAMRFPNGALASLAGNVDAHHDVAVADLVLVQHAVPQTVRELVIAKAPGIVGLSAGVLGASLLMAYAILGFAVLHVITRGMGSRAFTLGGVYLTVFVFGWPVLLMALLGLAENAFDFRGRIARRRGPPNPPNPLS